MNEVILVVDDAPKIVKQARGYLEHSGFLLAAGDGKTALAQARHEWPDLIVLDLNLPEMDGLDGCRALRHRERILADLVGGDKGQDRQRDRDHVFQFVQAIGKGLCLPRRELWPDQHADGRQRVHQVVDQFCLYGQAAGGKRDAQVDAWPARTTLTPIEHQP